LYSIFLILLFVCLVARFFLQQQLKRLEKCAHWDDSWLNMKPKLIAIVAVVLLVGCGGQSVDIREAAEHEITLPIGQGRGRLVTMFGTKTSVSWGTQGLKLFALKSPTYLNLLFANKTK